MKLRTSAVLVALASAIGGAEVAHAQAALLGPGAAYIGGGISRIGTRALNERLAERGYPTFGQTVGALNLGAYRLLSSGVLLGMEGHPLIIGEEAHQGREVGLAGGYGTLGIGYMIELSPRARVYPRLGLGGGGLALLIENETDSVSFDAVLADPRPAAKLHQPNLSRDGIVVDVGGGLELLRGRRCGALVGVRVGYLVAPWGSSWDLLYGSKASDVRGGPDANISGAYIRVVVGGAWRR